jgi:hypothetical protein
MDVYYLFLFTSLVQMFQIGISAAEWFRWLISNHLPLTAACLNRQSTFISITWGSYPADLWNVGGSTQIPACAWNNSQRATYSSTSKAQEYGLWLSCWCYVNPNKTTDVYADLHGDNNIDQ